MSEHKVTLDAAAARRLRAVASGRDARPPEFGAPEEAREEEGYQLSDEVGDVARQLIDSHPRFGHIDADRIVMGYALQTGKKPEGKGGLHLLAKAVKAPTLWRDLGQGFEVVVWANALAWGRLTEHAREALIAHELSHVGGRSEQGKVQMLEHDIEEFGWVVKQYGQWHSGLEYFAEQLGLGLGSKPTGEQAPEG